MSPEQIATLHERGPAIGNLAGVVVAALRSSRIRSPVSGSCSCKRVDGNGALASRYRAPLADCPRSCRSARAAGKVRFIQLRPRQPVERRNRLVGSRNRRIDLAQLQWTPR